MAGSEARKAISADYRVRMTRRSTARLFSIGCKHTVFTSILEHPYLEGHGASLRERRSRDIGERRTLQAGPCKTVRRGP